MPGLIDAIANDNRKREAKECDVALREQIEDAGKREVIDRERDVEARRMAMRAARSMTGRVIFPARWAIVPVEEHWRRCLRETLEGKVTRCPTASWKSSRAATS